MEIPKTGSKESLRRKAIDIAVADSGMEGFPPPSRPEQRIHEAFARGEIDEVGFMSAIMRMVQDQKLRL